MQLQSGSVRLASYQRHFGDGGGARADNGTAVVNPAAPSAPNQPQGRSSGSERIHEPSPDWPAPTSTAATASTQAGAGRPSSPMSAVPGFGSPPDDGGDEHGTLKPLVAAHPQTPARTL